MRMFQKLFVAMALVFSSFAATALPIAYPGPDVMSVCLKSFSQGVCERRIHEDIVVALPMIMMLFAMVCGPLLGEALSRK